MNKEITKSWIIKSENELKAVAKKLAEVVKLGDVILLKGNLGVGKTTFARFFINSLNNNHEEVVSPTFNYVLTYDSDKGTIWHFDLYRLESSENIEELGISEALDSGISLIEWPEVIENMLPNDKIEIKLRILDDNSTDREIEIISSKEI